MPTQFASYDDVKFDPRALSPAAAPEDDSGELSKGLRRGVASAGGQIQSALGGYASAGAEQLRGGGYPDAAAALDQFAKGRQAASTADQQEAADPRIAARVGDFRDVHGLRDAWDFGAGKLGESIPAVGAGVAGAGVAALTRGRVNPLIGASLATAPMDIGGVMQRQQADPEAQQRSASDNAARATGSGLASSALSNVVPAALGGKIVGGAAEKVGGSLLGSVAKDAAVNAGAGVGAEAAQQLGVDPNKPWDTHAMTDAGVGGALLGGVMGGAGHVASAIHGAPGAAVSGIVDGAKSLYGSAKEAATNAAGAVGDAAGAARDAVAEHTPQQVKDWNESIGAGISSATDALAGSITERVKAARAAYDAIKADPDVPGAIKAQAEAFMQNAGAKTSQAWFSATAKVADAARAYKAKMSEGEARPDTLGDLHAAANEDTTADAVAAGGTANTREQNQAFAAADPQNLRQHAQDAFDRTTEWATKTASDLSKRADLSPENQQKVNEFLADPGGSMKAAGVAAVDKAMKVKDSIVGAAQDLLGSKTVDGAGDAKRSEDLSGVRAAVMKVISDRSAVPKEVLADPVARNKVADAMRAFIHAASSHDIVDVNKATEGLRAILGDKTNQVLPAIYEAVGNADPAHRERFARNVLAMKGDGARTKSLETVLNVNLPDDRALSDGALRRMASTLKKWSTGRDVEGMTPSEAQLHHEQVREFIQNTYGPKADAVFKALESHAATEEGVPGQERHASSGSEKLNSDEVGKETDASTAAGAEFGSLGERTEHADYYGGGKDRQAMTPMQSPEAYRSKFPEFEGATEKLIKKLRAANPDKDVRFISERERNARIGEKGGAEDHGFVVVEGLKDKDQISGRDLDNMRLDSEKHSRSPSRLEIGTEGTRNVLVDAVKLTGHFLKNMEKGDGLPDIVRAGRAFMEGVSALQAQHGKFEIPDSTVIDKKGTTFGEAKKALRSVDVHSTELSDRPGMRERAEGRASANELVGASERLQQAEAKLGNVEKAMLEAMDAGDSHKEKELRSKWEDASARREEAWKEDAAGRELERAGKQEPSKDDQIHAASASLPEDKLVNRSNMAGEAHSVKDVTQNTKPLMLAARRMRESDTAIGRKIAGRLDVLSKGIYSMSAADQRKLLGVAEMKQVSQAAETVNALARKYKDVLAAPEVKSDGVALAPEARERQKVKGAEGSPDPKAQAAKKAALLKAASSSDPALLKELATTDNAKGLQRTVEVLAKADPLSKATETANARMDTLVQNPDVAYSLAAVHSKESVDKAAQGPADRAATREYLDKVLGDSVRAALSEKIGHAGEYIHAEKLIRISVHALNPLSVAYHESLHAFFGQLKDWGLHDVSNVLLKAASTEHAINQLNAHFKDQPEVLAQIKGDAEERAAYMYQLHQQGKFTVGPQTKTVFNKIADFIRSALGIWSNDQRALHIMDHFSSGEYAKNIGKPNAIYDATMKPGRNAGVDLLGKMTEPFINMGENVFAAGQAKLRDMDNAHIAAIADAVKPLHTSGGKDTGYLAAARNERSAVMNRITQGLSALSDKHMGEVLEQLQSGEKASTPEARLAAGQVKKELGKMLQYMRDAGLDVGDLGPDYFPRVWDAHQISKAQGAFRQMLEANGVKDSEATMRRIVANDGNSFDVDTRMPGFQSGKERVLAQISGKDAAPFQNKNLLETLNSYVAQATRRAEFARRFGADGKGLTERMDQAKASGATREQLETVEKYMKGVTGTLGDGINPTARRMIGNMLVYQNLRLLPLGVFSSMPDALGIVVRGGSAADAFHTFKRGFKEMAKSFKKYDPDAAKDWQTQAAETLGVIDNAMLTHAIGASYTQGMVGNTGRAVNDKLFKFNLMEQYNNSMRAGATGAAIHFIEKHGAGEPGTHSERYLSELGLTRADVKLDADGHLVLGGDRIRDAVNKWVDGAVLRPDAADKPIWMNDPHYALFAHLKQFMYSFHHTILTRVAHEAQHGNYKPALALAGYVPMMIAADAAKGLIQGGGSEPDWKAGWGPSDYLMNGVQRGGLFGVGQLGVDVAADIHRGGSGFGALTGPTVEQLTEAVKMVGGAERSGTFLLHSMPANALYGSMFKGSGQADPMFAD